MTHILSLLLSSKNAFSFSFSHGSAPTGPVSSHNELFIREDVIMLIPSYLLSCLATRQKSGRGGNEPAAQ